MQLKDGADRTKLKAATSKAIYIFLDKTVELASHVSRGGPGARRRSRHNTFKKAVERLGLLVRERKKFDRALELRRDSVGVQFVHPSRRGNRFYLRRRSLLLLRRIDSCDFIFLDYPQFRFEGSESLVPKRLGCRKSAPEEVQKHFVCPEDIRRLPTFVSYRHYQFPEETLDLAGYPRIHHRPENPMPERVL